MTDVLITGVCGFVGSSIARHLVATGSFQRITGIDNLIRPGSDTNRRSLMNSGVDVRHGDLRLPSDLESVARHDWVIDAAALPSVTAGIDGQSSSRQLIEHNLLGTINLLELCKQWQAGFAMLSTSRVYSIGELSRLKLTDFDDACCIDMSCDQPLGISGEGIDESFSTESPISLYGSTKLASETLASEYGSAFEFPVHINRCGVIAGPGQFGRADQGIFSFWVHSHFGRNPLCYIGFDGTGYQVRDCLDVRDLASLVEKQLTHCNRSIQHSIQNIGGGPDNAMSLKQLTRWCDNRFGSHPVSRSENSRPFDIPWVVMNTSLAKRRWGWRQEFSINETLEQIAEHAQSNPDWLKLSK